ncbi:glycine-rich domain-containing protein [Catellatospora coxensis]|uniref:Uncharacterized protein n=1 Tax=Catellatospora coxensis TaxID=310354 RepID=A0A8J3P5K7_9ACTN|nr:hypothetical protein [Catellatospora coxensis]GIG04816.1 hypothetical protein Cco03nite_15160 [Catellatospora coxensis]
MTTLLDPITVGAVLDDDLAALLVEDVQKKFPEWSDDYCRRGVAQMVGFLAACAVAAEPLSPSEPVDEFWHAFIVRTVPYAAFCERVAGRFIHHQPDDDREKDEQESRIPKAEAMRARAVEVITAAGHEVDEEFWPELAADCNSKCTQCYQGCHNSPK